MTALAKPVGKNVSAEPASRPRECALDNEIQPVETATAGNLLLQDLFSGGLRPQLEIGGSDDPEERAANSLATNVLTGSGQSPCACGASCPKCKSGTGAAVVRRSPDAGGNGPGDTARQRQTRSAVFFGSGRNMDLASRAYFEPRLGADLSHVRIHRDERTAQTARAIGAKAYTVGNNIGFARGQHNPATPAGRALMAHELAHVVLGHGGVRREGDGEEGRIMATVPAKAPPKEDTPTRPSSPMAYYANTPVANDAEFMRGTLRRLIGESGIAGADEWFGHFVRGHPVRPIPLPIMATTIAFRRPVRSPLDAQRDMYDEAIWNEARPTVKTVYAEVRAEAFDFINTFENNAITITKDILKASEASAEAERIRYGLERTETVTKKRHKESDGGWVTDYSVNVSHSMDDQLPGQALAGAAKDLLAKREEISSLAMQQMRLTKTVCSHGGCFTSIPADNQAAHDELSQKLREKRNELTLLQGTYQERYPVLSRISDDIGSLKALSKGPSAAAAEVLNDQVLGTLANIAKVRDELKPGGDASIWKLPDIVTLAKAASGASDPTSLGRMRNRVIDDKVAQIKDDQAWHERLMAVLIIGLSIIAAIPTGGGSLAVGATALAGIGAFTLGAIEAVKHVDEYMLDKAMAGSDLDRAKAISASDPSLFWLGLEIVGMIADLGPAVRGAKTLLTAGRTAFTTVSGATRRFLTTQGADSAKALAELRTAADAAERSSGLVGLSGRVVANAERLAQKGATVEKALGHAAGNEARAIANGVAELEKGVGRALGKSTTRAGGHTVSVMPNGWLVRCTVCGTLRAEFAVELGQNKQLVERLLDLEKRSASAAAKADQSVAKQIADEAASLADELQLFRSASNIKAMGPVAAEALFKSHPQLASDLAKAKALKGADADKAFADLMTRAERIENAKSLSLEDLEVMLDNKAFGIGTMSGTDLRYVRYAKNGGTLPFEQWESMAQRIWENSRFGTLRERELKQAYDLTKKNMAKMQNPNAKGVNFIPDHVAGNPSTLDWGKPYHFEEIKDWADMSNTGNLSAMLDYVDTVPGSKLTLYFKSNTYMSGPLRNRIDALMKSGKVDLIPFIGN
jgi:Domain of unknown function (DUF4157)